MSERIFLDMIERSCYKHGVDFRVLSDCWLIKFHKGGQERSVIGLNFDINTQAAAMIAKDKAATSALLSDANIPNIKHILLNPNGIWPNINLVSEGLSKGDIVLKPLEGGKGDLVARISEQRAAIAVFQKYPRMVWALSHWYDINYEVRVVVVDGSVRLAYKKTHPLIINNLKMFNLSKGARAESLRGDRHKIDELACRTARALGLQMAAIDIAVMPNDEAKVLEVNASFSLTRYAQTNNATYDEVALFYDQLIAGMFT